MCISERSLNSLKWWLMAHCENHPWLKCAPRTTEMKRGKKHQTVLSVSKISQPGIPPHWFASVPGDVDNQGGLQCQDTSRGTMFSWHTVTSKVLFNTVSFALPERGTKPRDKPIQKMGTQIQKPEITYLGPQNRTRPGSASPDNFQCSDPLTSLPPSHPEEGPRGSC